MRRGLGLRGEAAVEAPRQSPAAQPRAGAIWRDWPKAQSPWVPRRGGPWSVKGWMSQARPNP